MDSSNLDKLKATLVAERDRLQAEVAAMDEEDRETLSEVSGENNYRDHMADQGSATFERELDMTLEENIRRSLTEVRNSLDRIESGSYGKCERCGAEIPPARLEAVPTANLCIACKEEDECL
jgi:DnaK suppressor protein